MTRSDLSVLMMKVAFGEATRVEEDRLAELRLRYPEIDTQYREVLSDVGKVSYVLPRVEQNSTEFSDEQVVKRMQNAVSDALKVAQPQKKEISSRILTMYWATGLAAAVAVLLTININRNEGTSAPVTGSITGEPSKVFNPISELVETRGGTNKRPDAYLLVSGSGAEINVANSYFETTTTAPLMRGDQFHLRDGSEGLLFAGGSVHRLKAGERGVIGPEVQADSLPEMFSLSFEQFLGGLKMADLYSSNNEVKNERFREDEVVENVAQLAEKMFASGPGNANAEMLNIWERLPERYRNDPLISRFGLKLYAENGFKDRFSRLKKAVSDNFFRD